MTSEAVTNAILHAGTEVGLVVMTDGAHARVEVHDAHAGTPVRQSLRPGEPSGMGLHLIDSIAEAWGVQELDTGKCIWFEVRA